MTESKAPAAESKTPAASQRIGPDPEVRPGPQPFPHQVGMRKHADEVKRQEKFTPKKK